MRFDGPMTGEDRTALKRRPYRREMTRTRKRMEASLPSRIGSAARSFAGTTTRSVVRVARPARTKVARPPSRRKTTVLRPLPGRKPLPRSVSVSPTARRAGAMLLTDGYAGLAAAAVPGSRTPAQQATRGLRRTR
jgi:hypothetical protein